MPYVVGPKGQVVIAKEFREKLGVKSGWTAIQRLVGDHIEVYFLPPSHRRSLKGSLAKYTKIKIEPGEEWEKAREDAWNKAANEKETALREEKLL